MGHVGYADAAKSRRRTHKAQLVHQRQTARTSSQQKRKQVRQVSPTQSALAYLSKIRHVVASTSKKQSIRKQNRRRKRTGASKIGAYRQPTHSIRRTGSERSEGSFGWPIDPKNFWLSSPFGPRKIRGKEKFHGGIDMAAPTGTHVFAAGPGKVIESRYSPGYGNYILLSHPHGYKTRYAHLSKSLVRTGQSIAEGQLIGKVGATGHVVKRNSRSSGAHLHFEIYKGGAWVDPVGYMQ